MNDLWGEIIHGYERHDLIGEGASGIVYRATDTHTGVRVGRDQVLEDSSPHQRGH